MRIVGYNPKNPRPTLAAARSVLQRGGVIVYPTETSYGIGADPLRLSAVQKIYAIKKRHTKLLLPFVAASLALVERWCVLSPLARRLARNLWPGPFTIILPVRQKTTRQKKLMRHLRTSEIAIRVPSHEMARKLSHLLDRPFIATSANISRQSAAFSAEQARRIFAGHRFQPDLIVDGGVLQSSQPSTIVRIDEHGTLQIVRTGVVSKARIQSFL